MLSRGTRLDQYVLEEPLGVGGMGEVYLALDTTLERRVALKLLPSGSAQDRDARARMIREARAASALRHHGIVTIYGVGEDEERSYIAMELVDGETFSQLVARRGALPAAEALELVAKVGEALAAAHRAGILHRDVKGQNLMVEPGGHVKVLDFGLSKRIVEGAPPPEPASDEPPPAATPLDPLDPDSTTVAASQPSGDPHHVTRAGTRMGTPAYSAPELWEGRPVDARCDVFSLAVVLYELLVGRRPFAGDGATDVRAAIDQQRFTPPSDHGLDPRLDDVLARAFRVDPAKRTASVTALVAEARAALRARRRGWLAVAGLALAAGAGAVGWSITRTPLAAPPLGLPARRLTAASAVSMVPRPLTHFAGCASNPTLLREEVVVFELWHEGSVDLYAQSLAAREARPLVSAPTMDWRAHVDAERRQILFVQTDLQAKTGIGQSRVVKLEMPSGDELWSRPVVAAGVAPAPGGLYYVRGTGRQIRQLTGDGESVIVDLPAPILAAQITSSADGARIAFVPETGLPVALCLVDVAARKLDCRQRPGIFPSRPAFSDDGETIYYASVRGIVRHHVVTQAEALVVPGVWAGGGITLSQDGGTLVYSDCIAHGQVHEVTAEPPVDVLDQRRLGALAMGRGGQLAYTRHFPDGDVIVVRDAAGQLRELSDTSVGALAYLTFDPTGAWLVFATAVSGGEGLYVVATDGKSPVRRLTTGLTDQFPVWFTEGRIVFSRPGPDRVGRLHYVDVATGAITLASEVDRAAYAARADTGELLVLSAKRERVEWWNPATGRRRPGPPFALNGMGPSHSAFSPSGTWMLLGVGNGQEFYRLDLRKRDLEAELVYSRPAMKMIGVLAIDDDGRVFLQDWQWQGNLFTVSLPLGGP